MSRTSTRWALRLLGLLCGVGVLLAACVGVRAPAGDDWPTHGWRTSTPEAQGMDSLKLAQLLEAIRQDQSQNLDSLLVIRHGYLVSEVYYSTEYGPNTLHHAYSTSKSFTSTLIGIALDKGILKGLRQPVLDYFPRLTIENRDARKEAMTLEDLLTMQSGLDWHEDNDNNGAMTDSLDAAKYVLDMPMQEPPGSGFLYCSGCTQLLGEILEQQPGVQTLDFARKNLFEPLGITNYQWDLDKQGVVLGGFGLYLTPRDMAKLGYLFLRGGFWDGRQIVSTAWVNTATATHTDPHHPLGLGYGYQWWTFPSLGAYMASGHAGQTIFVDPALDLVVVVTADETDQANGETLKLIESYILPSIKSSTPLPANPAGQSELAAQTKASWRALVLPPLLPSDVQANALQWSALLLGFFGLWALAGKRVYLGAGEVTGWPTLAIGLLAMFVVLFQFTHQTTCNLIFASLWRPDPGALALSVAAICGGWLAGRRSKALLPAPRRVTATVVFLACGVAAGCWLGIALAAPALFTQLTLEAWARPLLAGLGMTALVLVLLRFSDAERMVTSWPAALTGGLLIGWLFGYLCQEIINFLGPSGASLSTIARQGPAPLLASLAALWPSGHTFADLANHWVVLILIALGVWVVASRKLYLGGRYQITGWGAGGLGLLVLGTTWFESHAGQNDALANYLLTRCFTSDLVAYLLSLGVLFGGLLVSRTAAPAVPRTGRPTLARLVGADWVYTAVGLAGGCLLGVALRDPLLLSGASPWLAVRLVVTALGLAVLAVAALSKGSLAQGTMPKVAILAGGLMLGWVLGYLGESILWAVWPVGF